MAECEMKVRNSGLVPLGNLRLNNENGCVEWTFIPVAASGSVKTGRIKSEGKDSILIIGAGKFSGKPYG